MPTKRHVLFTPCWILIASMSPVAWACPLSENLAIVQQESRTAPCRVESDRRSYLRGQPILLQVWCSRAPIGSSERRVVDDLMIGKSRIVVGNRIPDKDFGLYGPACTGIL